MRNLKKILALVLALMMVLSMMVTASATTFVDDADIDAKYAEAVTVLSAIGVIRGNPTGEEGEFAFDPTGELTRAQAATIISYVLLGDLESIEEEVELYENPFTDVPNWAVPTVLFAHSQGIIIGRNATTFDAKGTITGYELGKMLLIASDICEPEEFAISVWVVDGKAYAEYEDALVASVNAGGAAITTKSVAVGDWKLTVAKELKLAGIWDSEFKLSKKLTREEACYLTFNTMNASTLMDAFEVTETEETVDALGRPLENVWTDAKGNVLYSESPAYTVAYTAKTTDATIKEDLGVTKLPGGSNPTKNGRLVEYYLVDVAKDGTKTYSYVTIDYRAATLSIADADKDGNVAYTLNGTKYYDYSATYATTKKVTDTVALHGDVAHNAVVTYVVDSNKVAHIYPTETVTGVLTSKSSVNGTLTIGGTKYTKSEATGSLAITNAAYALGAISVQLDQFGFVVGTTNAPIVTGQTLAFVVDFYHILVEGTDATLDAYGKPVANTGTPDTYYLFAQCVDMNNQELNLCLGVALDNEGEISENVAVADWYVAALQAAHVGKIQAVKYDNTYKIYSFEAPTAGTVVTATLADKKVSFTDGTNNYYYNNAEFVSVQGNLGDLAVSAGTLKGALHADVDVVVAVVSNASAETTNKIISKVFYYNDEAPELDPDYSTAIWATGAEMLEESSVLKKDALTATPIYTHAVYINGEAAEINTYVEEIGMGFYSYIVDEYDVYTLVPVTDVIARVENVYGSYVTFEDLAGETWDVADFDVTGIPVVNLSKGNKTIDKGDYVVFYAELNDDEEYEIACIYIIDGGSYVMATGAGWTLYADGNYVVTNDAGLEYALANVAEGKTITLTAGEYETLNITADNLSIVGGEGVEVAGVLLTGNTDGLTFKGINIVSGDFTTIWGFDGFTHKNLTVTNCEFGAESSLFLYNAALVENLKVTNCKFAGSHADEAAILVSNVNGATITGNTIENSTYNGIQLGDKVSGDVVISGNTIKNTTDRGIRLALVQDEATVTIMNNKLVDACDEDDEVFKVDTVGTDAKVVFEGNTYQAGTADAADWDPADITETAEAKAYTTTVAE